MILNFKKKVVHVRHSMCYFEKDGKYVYEMHDTKTHSGSRDIPLTYKAVVALKEQYLRKQNIVNRGNEPLKGYEDLVFVTKNNNPTTTVLVGKSMDSIVKNIIKNYGDINFKRLTPHTFRHTFAARCIENGIQPKTVQKYLGHATLHMTMDLYCHVTEDTLFEEMEKYEKANLYKMV